MSHRSGGFSKPQGLIYFAGQALKTRKRLYLRNEAATKRAILGPSPFGYECMRACVRACMRGCACVCACVRVRAWSRGCAWLALASVYSASAYNELSTKMRSGVAGYGQHHSTDPSQSRPHRSVRARMRIHASERARLRACL